MARESNSEPDKYLPDTNFWFVGKYLPTNPTESAARQLIGKSHKKKRLWLLKKKKS